MRTNLRTIVSLPIKICIPFLYLAPAVPLLSFMNRIILGLILFISSVSAAAQPSIRVEKYTTRDGLSSNNILRALKDSNGFLWLATVDGLNRFDGKDFKIFRNRPGDTLSIPGNIVYRIAEDPTGDLWVMTSKGLCRYVQSKNYFKRFDFPWIDNVEKQYSIEPSLMVDGDVVWFTDYEGINAMDTKTYQVKRYKLRQPFKGRHLISLGKDSYGRIFAGSTDGIFLLDAKTGVFEKAPMPYSYSAPNSFYTSSDKSLWIAVWLDAVLNLKDTLNKVVKFGGKESLFNVFEVGADSLIACGDYPGLLTFSRRNPEFKSVSLINKSTGMTESFVINSIASFDSNFVWFCGSEGLLKWDRRPAKFKTITFQNSKVRFPLKINAFISDPDNPSAIWVNVWYQNLLRYDGNSRETTYFFDQHQKPLASLPWGYYNGLYPGESGEVWITGQFGIWRFDKKKNDFVQLRRDQHPESLIHQPCYRIQKISNGNFITIARGKGIVEFNSDLSFYKEYVFDFKDKSIRDLSITSMVEHDSNTILFCSAQTGLYSLDRRTGKFKHIIQDPKGLAMPANMSMIEKDSRGNVWIGTLENIVVLDSSLSYRISYGTQNGLPSNRIQYIFQDSRGTMWITTKGGLSYFDPGRNVFINYANDDGLLDNDSYFLNELRTGEIAVGHEGGISILKNPLKLGEGNPPTIRLTEIFIGDNEYPGGSTGSVRVKPGEGSLQIRFAAIDFAKGHNITYSYKLEGLSDWTPLGNKNVLNFFELPPGEYTLFVDAVNSTGIKCASPLRLKIDVLAPFYQTWWFRLMVLSLTGMIIYSFYHVRRQKRIELEKIRDRLSRDLHDDIGSTLSSISMLTKSARRRLLENDGKALSESLEKIGDRTTRLLENMSDIIWNVKPENDSLDLVLARMREYASSVLESKRIPFDIDFPESTEGESLSLEIKNNLYMIFKEAVNNSMKYSECTHIYIQFKIDKGVMELTITDNGKGFDPDTVSSTGLLGGNGLNNMRKRAEDMEARLEIKSAPGKGTTVYLRK